MTTIIAFLGKKKTGKDTLCEFLIRNSKELFKTDSIEKYAFADPIKEFCVEYLDLDRNMLYGTDEDKNKLTNITWLNMPHYEKIVKNIKDFYDKNTSFGSGEEYIEIHSPKGLMTYREVVQNIADAFKIINPNIWTNKLVKNILSDNKKYAIISDMRFPYEATTIKSLGGIVIKLERDIESNDNHNSEVMVDNCEYDYLLDNGKEKLDVKYKKLVDILREANLIKE